MTETMFIRLPANPGASAQWLTSDPSRPSCPTVHQGSLTEAASQCGGRSSVVVFVPASQLVVLQATVPTRNRARMAQAIPYSLEERFAEDVEQLHFALGRRMHDQVAVAVVAKRDMAVWTEMLHAAQIEADALVPDVLALPWKPGQWSALIEDRSCLVRTGPASGWAAEVENLRSMLNLALRDSQPPEGLHLFAAAGEDPYDLDGIAIETTQESHSGAALTLLAAHYHPAESINLLQGSYRNADEVHQVMRRWLWVAGLTLALIGMEVLSTAVQSQRLEAQLADTAQRIDNVFRNTFPGVRRVVNPRVQMQQQLDRMRAAAGGDDLTGGFLPLLDRVAPILSAHKEIQLQSLNYRNQHLEVRLQAPTFKMLDDVKDQLLTEGLHVEIDSASAQDRGVSGQLLIRGATS